MKEPKIFCFALCLLSYTKVYTVDPLILGPSIVIEFLSFSRLGSTDLFS